MSAYLARLKQLESVKNSHYTPNTVPSKPSKVPFEPFEGSHLGHIDKKNIDNAQISAPPEPSENPAFMTASDEKAIRTWLTHIGETDQDVIDGVLAKCRMDTASLNYFIERAVDTCGTPAKTITANKKTKLETLHDLQMETRRQRVIALMIDSSDKQRVYFTDMDSDPDNVILVIGIQHVTTLEMLIPKTKYDPFKLMQLIGQHGQITH